MEGICRNKLKAIKHTEKHQYVNIHFCLLKSSKKAWIFTTWSNYNRALICELLGVYKKEET